MARAILHQFDMQLEDTDMQKTANSVCNIDEWTEVKEYVVPAQEEITVGQNSINGGVDNRSTTKISVADASGVLTAGKMRIELQNKERNAPSTIIHEDSLINMTAGVKIGISGMKLFDPRKPIVWVGKDSVILVKVKLPVAKTVVYNSASNVTNFPVTKRTISGGN